MGAWKQPIVSIFVSCFCEDQDDVKLKIQSLEHVSEIQNYSFPTAFFESAAPNQSTHILAQERLQNVKQLKKVCGAVGGAS